MSLMTGGTHKRGSSSDRSILGKVLKLDAPPKASGGRTYAEECSAIVEALKDYEPGEWLAVPVDLSAEGLKNASGLSRVLDPKKHPEIAEVRSNVTVKDKTAMLYVRKA